MKIGHLSHEGNRWLKWILIEAAQHAWRPTNPYHAFYQKLKRRKGSKIARVAIARKITEAIFWMWKRGEDFNPPRKEITAVPA